MTEQQAHFIDGLRQAAKENGSVYDLLILLEEGLLIDNIEKNAIVAEKEDLDLLKAAQEAAAFARLDRNSPEITQ